MPKLLQAFLIATSIVVGGASCGVLAHMYPVFMGCVFLFTFFLMLVCGVMVVLGE